MRVIHFVTSNKGKLLEAQKAIQPQDIVVKGLEIPYPEIQASSLKEVAEFGMCWLPDKIKKEEVKEVMIEDAGIFISALNDFPGVYSAYVFKSIGLDGILRLLEKEEDRGAHFESCVAYCKIGSEPFFFQGTVKGNIAREPRGQGGFGYDPIFVPEGEERSFAEMTTDQKNKHSHRGKALEKLGRHLKETNL